jgi:hypothetical protein
MGATYEVNRISAELIDRAYPLVISAAPRLDLEGWRALCRNVVNREVHPLELDDVFIASNSRSYIRGVCVAGGRIHALLGKVLDVRIFVLASAADEPGVAAAMIEYLKSRAIRESCSYVRIWGTSTNDDWTKSLVRMMPWENGILLPLEPDCDLQV